MVAWSRGGTGGAVGGGKDEELWDLVARQLERGEAKGKRKRTR